MDRSVRQSMDPVRRGVHGPGVSVFGSPNQSRSAFSLFVLFVLFVSFFLFFFSVSVKVLPVTPLVSGVFVHRAFCVYFLRIERVVELRRFLWWTQ